MTDPDRESVPRDGLELPDNARALLDAVIAISSDLDLHSVLDRIVVSACRITGARYGALGVIGQGGGLVDFVTHGLTPEQHAAIGDLPRGHGILGLLIDDPRPLRLPHLTDHPRSYGFPQNHPPMDRFLGVPVRIRGTVFGNLYLTEKEGGGEFTATDEQLVDGLATAAGFVIENARAYALSERRRQWLEATQEVVEALQPPVRLDDALRKIAIGARRVTDAVAVAVVRSDDTAGPSAVAWDGRRSAELGTVVKALDEHIAAAVEHSDVVVAQHGDDTAVLVPLRAHLAPDGVLLVLLDSEHDVLASDEAELLAAFADQAALALDRAQAISDRQELLLVSDRDRIARDLHDIVIQRLFATGLQLQGARRTAVSDDVRRRIDAAVGDLDTTIRDIRATIFELQHGHDTSLRAEVRALVKEYTPILGFNPLVRTGGPLDTAVPQHVGDQLLAVLREALSNVARHSGADAAVVEVEAGASELVLRVADNGRGLPEQRQESGLRNARRRATDHGGTLELRSEEPSGTALVWTVPLRGDPES
jgi:signal transduction histidine kinase